MNRRAAAPPTLPGYTFVRNLGGGGFADVYLYDQHRPRRQVAVKVLAKSADTAQMRAQFDDEADLMAAVSSHPSIVTIHEAAVSSEGSPYLVMEYCSKENLAQAYRAREISLTDALRIAVQLAGAVESAHRAGILHRDIKPANVLTTDFNRPALTDFGISVSTAAALNADQVGLSIPWSPPEMCTDVPAGDARADTYSLAATIYTILARRTPFEIPGRPTSQAELIHRILHTPLPPINRPDVPPPVTRVLSKAMNRNPDARYPSALEFARAVQRVQAELGLVVTTVDVVEDDPDVTTLQVQDDGLTRVRPLISIDAQAGTSPPPGSVDDRWAPRHDRHDGRANTGPVTSASVGEATTLRPPTVGSDHTQLRPAIPVVGDYSAPDIAATEVKPADTVLRSMPPPDPQTAAVPPTKRTPVLLLIGAVVVLAVSVLVIILTRGTDVDPGVDESRTQLSSLTQAAIPDLVLPPTGLSYLVQDGNFVFSWVNPTHLDGDAFQWRRTDLGPGQTFGEPIETPSLTLPVESRVCIEVRITRSDGHHSDTAGDCATPAGSGTTPSATEPTTAGGTN